MRSSAFIVLFLVFSARAFALEGRVIDKDTRDPIARAEVSILGRPGSSVTDDDGRFTWHPDPAPPFEVLVVLRGERYTKPVLVEALPASGPLIIEVTALVNEAITVTAGAAPELSNFGFVALMPVAGR